MKNKTGPKPQAEYKCRCCGAPFKTSKQRAKHEYKKRTTGAGPDKKRFKTCESEATPSLNGEKLEETKMDFEFDVPLPPPKIQPAKPSSK